MVPTAIELGSGGLGLNGPAITKRFFFAASLSQNGQQKTILPVKHPGDDLPGGEQSHSD